MEMEQMMTRLLAEIRTNRKEMRAVQEHLKEEMMAKLNAHYERIMTRTDSQLETMEAARDISEEMLNKMDSTDLEANREKSEVLAEQQDVPKAEDAVKNIGAPQDGYGGPASSRRAPPTAEETDQGR
jgi:predicted glycosyltransferase